MQKDVDSTNSVFQSFIESYRLLCRRQTVDSVRFARVLLFTVVVSAEEAKTRRGRGERADEEKEKGYGRRRLRFEFSRRGDVFESLRATRVDSEQDDQRDAWRQPIRCCPYSGI